MRGKTSQQPRSPAKLQSSDLNALNSCIFDPPLFQGNPYLPRIDTRSALLQVALCTVEVWNPRVEPESFEPAKGAETMAPTLALGRVAIPALPKI